MEIKLKVELSKTHFSGKDIGGKVEVDEEFLGINFLILCIIEQSFGMDSMIFLMIEKGRMSSRNEKK